MDYKERRVNYINSWPESEPFEAEKIYQKTCDDFFRENSRPPFLPMKLWILEDINYNKLISHLIDSLDVMPIHPNFAFSFMFSGWDYYVKEIYGEKNITKKFKMVADEISVLNDSNVDIKSMFDKLFKIIPVNAFIYLYKLLSDTNSSNIKKRVITDKSDKEVQDRKDLVDAIYIKYGYDKSRYCDIRNAALLYRKIFHGDIVEINNTIYDVSVKTKLYLLILGILYSFRNDSTHGSSMASTKSSGTTQERYALNYFCYLCVYTISMTFLIMKSDFDKDEKVDKYKELKEVTNNNIENYKLLFGNNYK